MRNQWFLFLRLAFAPREHTAFWMLVGFVEATRRGYLILTREASGRIASIRESSPARACSDRYGHVALHFVCVAKVLQDHALCVEE